MNSEELKDLFIAEALENQDQLDKLFIDLEKNPQNKRGMEAIFRILHTLKANASAMGYNQLSEMAHILEDIFVEAKQNPQLFNAELFDVFHQANDKLRANLQALQDNQSLSHLGFLTRLQVYLRNLKEIIAEENGQNLAQPENTAPAPVSETLNTTNAEDLNEAMSEGLAETPANPIPETKPQKKIGSLTLTQVHLQDPLPALSPEISLAEVIPISIKKLDSMLNLVGELAIEQDRIFDASNITQNSQHYELSLLKRVTTDLQYAIMSARLIPIQSLFQKFHRIIRDTAAQEYKQVDLVLEGTEIEIDRNILQIISDSLIHLVRNAVSHGIEDQATRQTLGKSSVGTITLSARNDKDSVLIEVKDDGRGIDLEEIKSQAIAKGLMQEHMAQDVSENELISYIFAPGFSSATQVSEISGRGIGMSVVKKAMDKVGGSIQIHTQKNQGTTFQMALPVSLALRSVILFRCQDTVAAVPLTHLEKVNAISKKDIRIINNNLTIIYNNTIIPLLFLNDLFKPQADFYQLGNSQEKLSQFSEENKSTVLLVSSENRVVGLVIDQLLQKKEVVEKKLSYPLRGIKLLTGAATLSDGRVCLILNIPYLIQNGLKPDENKEKKDFHPANAQVNTALKITQEFAQHLLPSLVGWLQVPKNAVQMQCQINPTFQDLQAKGTPYYFIKSQIQGDFEAENILLVDLESAEGLWPPPHFNPGQSGKDLQLAFLMESANIFTASVVTMLTNQLKLQAFGGVPDLQELSEKETLQNLYQQSSNYSQVMMIKMHWRMAAQDIQIKSIWYFDPQFISTIDESLKLK